jgi:hypothetical protein
MRTVKLPNDWRSSARAVVRGLQVSRPRRLSGWCAVWFIASMFVLASCASPLRAVPVDPGVDFAAHVEHRGLVIDRAHGPEPAVLVPAGSLFSRGPNYLLEADGKTLAALWVKDLAHVTVRRTADPAGPVLGRVGASWKEGAIRLTLTPADGPALQTGRFHRVDGPGPPELLTSDFGTVLDERGMYLAELRDEKGNAIGWLRVRISPYQAARRIYDADLPPSVPEPLATAAVALVNANIRESENHAVDVYLGN